MTIARQYGMIAVAGTADQMREVLIALAQAVRGLAGCLGVELLQSESDETRFQFIEKWESVEAHKAAPFPKEAMAALKPLLAGPPVSDYLRYCSV